MNPLVSMLIPSRKRLESLKRAITSIRSLAAAPEQVEIIVRLHHSDRESVEWALPRRNEFLLIIGDDMDAFRSADKFTNSMAAASSGDWLWSFADDFEIVTRGWDNVLAGVSRTPRTDFIVRHAEQVGYPNERVSIVSRGFYNVIGSLGHTEFSDTYIDALAWSSQVNQMTPLSIQYKNHFVPGVEGVFRDRKESWKTYQSRETAQLFDLDKLKLGAVLGRKCHAWTTSDATDLAF